MSRKSASGRIVRKSAAEIKPPTKEDWQRLQAALEGPIDFSDIPERREFHPLKRDAYGKLPSLRSIIRRALVREVERQNLSAKQLWRMAQKHCRTLSLEDVEEFLSGIKNLDLLSVDALLMAANLQIVSSHTISRPRPAPKRRALSKV